PMLTDLIVSGILGGVGAVLGFLPLIIVLFFCLGVLEEVGYMARVAYVLDRIFVKFGLSGKAVIPAVIGIGCGVPAIMGTRTIEDESNRNVSVICTTFMPCGAKLPILTVVVAGFFHASAAVTLSLYLLGIVMILLSGLFLKKFPGFIGKPSPFIMELPVYHAPNARNLLTGVTEKSWAFVRKAGTLILLSAVIIWVMSSFDWSFRYLGDGETNGSILSDIGKALCWIFIPNGFGGNDLWELTVASITGLMAKENLLATVAVLIDAAVDAEDMPTTGALAAYLGSCAFPYAVAMSFLIFNLLCAPCFAAIGAMHRELGAWKRTGIAVLYQCATAYGVSTIYYQSVLLFNGVFGLGILWLVLFLAVPIYVFVSKDPLGPVRRLMGRKG
ncbi:MAG: ferrous iron transporter B, partial [archaeon]|nr:ferrous iron transporter B [archaeon]